MNQQATFQKLPTQDMACDTFLKICSKCRRKFVVLQLQEREPFISGVCGVITAHCNTLCFIGWSQISRHQHGMDTL